MRPVLFQIGDLTFYSFGLMVALALIVPALFIVRPLLVRRGVHGDFVLELIIAVALSGFVGARIFWLVQNWEIVRPDLPGSLIGGVGFVWYGGFIGGVIGVIGWTLLRRIPLGPVANAMAVGIALGYAIGRMGCHLSGDGDYGKPSTVPWAIGYPNGTVPTPPGVLVHPTPIYEIIAMSFVTWVLWRLATRYNRSGWWTFGWFLVLSGVERLLVEFVRCNPVWHLGLTVAQWLAMLSIVAGGALIAVYKGRPAEI